MKEAINKTLGNQFEAEFCGRLAEYGFWAHNLAQNQEGQPADVIAVKGDKAALIDCKVCLNNSFPFSRVEPNQESAMTLWEQCGNSEAYFALRLRDWNTYMIPFDYICNLQLIGKTALNESLIRGCQTLEEWVESYV